MKKENDWVGNLEHGILKKLFTFESSKEGDFDPPYLMIPSAKSNKHKWSIECQSKDGPI